MLMERNHLNPETDTSSAGVSVFLALGGNLGDRRAVFADALRKLNENGFRIRKVSSVYETPPVGCEPGAGNFYNAVASGFWNASPEELLALCQRLEQEAGRAADHPHWQSRILDLDLIAFGMRRILTERLSIPHPLATESLFVMMTLAEIAPDFLFPGAALPADKIAEDLCSRQTIPQIVLSPEEVFFCKTAIV